MELYDQAYDLLCDGKTDEAIAAYQALLESDPTHVNAIHDLAHAYADKGMLDEAIAMARRLTELTPEDPMAFTVLSRFYQQKGMYPRLRPKQPRPACSTGSGNSSKSSRQKPS